MTVLKSLLSTFRNSRTSSRKPGRSQAVRGNTAESLEQRLLLTNPYLVDSNAGAPLTIFLDFDGHTETDAAWTNVARSTPIVTPQFSVDSNASAFSDLDRDTTEEIFLRVAEDFAPFANVNVTTNEPSSFNQGEVIRVSIGGEGRRANPTGSWSTRPYNDALRNGFTDTNLSNTVFVFPRDYTSHPQTLPLGRSGQLGRDVANGVSEAVGIAMGLTEPNRSSSPEVSPLVGTDTFAVGWRDVWSNQLGQDDLSILTNNVNGLEYVLDDHGNTFATATSVAATANDEVRGGIIAPNNDVDLFHFNTAATTATFFVEGLDLTNRVTDLGNAFTSFGVTNAGSNLDPELTLFDANGVVIDINDPVFGGGANASLKASITQTLPAGDYYLQVSPRGEYGNLGEYTLTVTGIDAPSAIDVPPLQSHPGSDVTFFLDFNGGVATSEIIAGRADGINQPFHIPVYDTDGDRTSFSAQEEAEINEIFQRVAEDFAPFDVNVTTIDPFLYGFRQGLQVVIGGDGSWQGPTGTGFTELNTFGTGTGSNMAVSFSELFTSNKEAALETSAVIANALGIETHLEFDGAGNPTGNRLPGFPAYGPIGGDAVTSLRDIFFNAGGSTPIPQDTLALITGSDNRITYRPDDHGNDVNTATIINLTTSDEILKGVIETNNDVDLFSFETRMSNAVISITGLDLTVTPGVTNPGANLDPVLELLDVNGVVIQADGDFIPPNPENVTDPNSLKASITRTIPSGRYFIRVSNFGDYGNIGTYTITIKGVDGTNVSLSFEPTDPNNPTRIAIAENAGTVVGIGRLQRPSGQPTSLPLNVNLISTDTSELTVPALVTIPPGQSFVNFDVTAVDDTILDGEQRVVVEAYVGGSLNSSAIMRVEDHETISATLNPNPVKEDAGVGGAVLTVTRSNTDIGADNHWVSVGDKLREYDADGNLVRTVPIAWPTGGVRPAVEVAHDIQVLQDGNIAVFNGTGTAFLSVYNVSNDSWQHFAEPGLSANTTADPTIGGIATIGDFVFLSDFESFDGDPRGIVRVNTFTGAIDRFADSSVGSRLFVEDSSRIQEIHPVTGEVLNVITLPFSNLGSRQAAAVAFDGAFLWALIDDFGSFNTTIELLKLNPDTGAVLETHNIPGAFSFSSTGMTVMNGLIYINDPFSSNTFNNSIQAYDPVARQLLGNRLPVESLNSIVIGSSIGSIPSANRLLVTGYPTSGVGIFNTRVYEINPNNGVVTASFPVSGGLNLFSDGISSVSDVVVGTVTHNELIYLNGSFGGVQVFERNGTPLDVDPATSPIDPVPNTGFNVFGDLGGGDVPGVSAQDQSFRDVAIGLGDNLLYGLLDSGSEIAVHDPNTLARVGSVVLDAVVNAIAVDDDGNILGGGGNGIITLFSPAGITQTSVNTGLGTIADVETNVSQAVIAGDTLGQVTTGTLDGIKNSDPSQFTLLETTGVTAFVSFGRHPFLPTGDLFVSLTSDDVSELSVPLEVRIPVGQPSVSVPIDVVDDNLLDGPQLVNVAGITDNYVSVPTVVTVLDAETIGVDVIPATVTETDGTITNGVRIFRTDVDGPFTVPSSTAAAVTSPFGIVDNDVTLSQVSVRDQEAVITDVNLTLSLQHSFIPDLDVYLISPSGTRVELFTDLGSNETNMTKTTFDDEAAVRIVDGVAPFTGKFVPEQLLSRFDGEDPSGVWTLEVVDDNVTDAGTLFEWSLDIKTVGLSATQVTLISSDPSEATVITTTVTIPPSTAEIFVDLNAIDDDIVDGTQPATISVNTINLSGFDLGSDTVDVLDIETLTITLDKNVISEGDGVGAIMATITRSDTALTDPLDVNLVSNDSTELAVPATVTFAPGESSITFPIDAVDDPDFDGDQTVTFSAAAVGYISEVSPTITVTDQEPRLFMSTLSQTVAEDAGTILISISRLDATDVSFAQQITLQSDDISELTVPATFLIPVNAVSTTFVATILEDDLLDGSQTVTITAADSNTVNPAVNSGTLVITVDDAEFVQITVPSGGDSFLENAGAAVTATVTLSAPNLTADVVVSLGNSDLTEVSIPPQVVIPAGETMATFTIHAVNDNSVDRDQLVTLTGSAPQYRDGTLVVTVKDHEPPTPIGPSRVTENPKPALQWAPVENATRYDLWLNDVSRNIVQLYRLENLPAHAPFFYEDFESGVFSTNNWTNSGATIDGLGLGEPSGSLSAHLNGGPINGDRIQTAAMDLSSRVGVQLKYEFQQTGGGESPEAGEDLVVSYRNAAGLWIVLERQPGAAADMTVFKPSVVQLPAAALHSNFALRFESIGKSTQDEVVGAYDDWFVDNIELSELEQFVPPQELGVGLYRMWVRAYDNLEQAGFWSPGYDFRIRTRPQIISPANNSTIAETQPPVISWSTVVDTSYDLWVNDLTRGVSQVIRQSNLQTTSLATAAASLPGGTYKAWVRAEAPDGLQGFWSAPVTFTILSAPTDLQPTGATFDRTPELGWSSVVGAEFYDVWVTRRNPGELPVIALRDQFVSGTVRLPENDLDSGRYAMWVRAIAADGIRSAWSDVAEFSIGGRPEILSPVDESVVTSPLPTISWGGIDGSDRYELWMNRTDIAITQIVYQPAVSITSFTVTTPLASGTYRVWVRAISDMGEKTAWSRPVDFTVASTDIRERDNGLSDTMLVTLPTAPAEADLQQTFVVTPLEETEPLEVTVDADVAEDNTVPLLAEEPLPNRETPEMTDSVMADWDSANWWTAETQSEDENAVPAAAVLGLGLLSNRAVVRKNSRHKRQQ